MRAMDRIACSGCGRSFMTFDGKDMLAAIRGPCPDCGGTFALDDGAPQDPPATGKRSTASSASG